jgi:hypothetical protein
MYTEQMTQALSVLGKLDPQSLAAGTDTSITNIDMSKFRRLMFIVEVGSVGAAGTVDFKLQESKTSGGTYQDISGTAITQITATGKIATVEIRAEQLDAGYQFVRHSLTIGGNAVLVGVVALGGEAVEKPGKAQDIAAVAQRVVL